jgi:pyruvate dehydrogenase phosphatase
MQQEHPGEPHVCRNGRVLGQLEPTRAFGDAIYKWSAETAYYVKKSFFGRSPSPLLKTPPYVTAEPIVTTTKIEPEKGDFLVLGCDGLWECLTNEEVIGLVGQWVDSQDKKGSTFAGLTDWFSFQKQSLPVENKPSAANTGKDGQRPPVRQEQWQVEGDDKRFVFEDSNVATHIIRNALGGRNREMVSALLSLPSPYSRRYRFVLPSPIPTSRLILNRDDLTVQVIFFGSGPSGGDVVPNLEASNSMANGKPKL